MKTRRSRTITQAPSPSRSSPRRAAARVSLSAQKPADDINTDGDELVASPWSAHFFDGVNYPTYQAMVDAKRQRNQERLRQSGLLDLVAEAKKQPKPARKRQKSVERLPPRKSNRLAGVASDGLYVEDERAGRFAIATAQGTTVDPSRPRESATKPAEPEHYRSRINDGEPLSLAEAVEQTGPKWVNETSVSAAEELIRTILRPAMDRPSARPMQSNRSVASMIEALSIEDENCVAKVVPDRIYGIAAHPSELIVAAGDKSGYIGLWNVDSRSTENDGVHLFRYHRGAAASLQWTPTGRLFSTSYDGTVRVLDPVNETFDQVFATYDDTRKFAEELGYKIDTGYSFWTQFGCLDPRFNTDQCFFVSTSVGTALHIDLRAGGNGKLTFHKELSEKKINTLSLHPNGHPLLSAGLDCEVKVWDVRKLGRQPLSAYHCGKSVNSAYFSPSGEQVVATTMANKLELFDNVHTTAKKKLQPSRSIRHDNHTGRWLSTFMATWHPTLDVFCVGSMSQPRCVEIYDGECLRAVRGAAMTAVASRCCFFADQDRLIVVGGNSSGRVTIVR